MSQPVIVRQKGASRMRRMLAVILMALSLITGLIVAPSTNAQNAEVQVTIFHDTHFHGNLLGSDGTTFANYIGLIEKLRSELPQPGNSLFVGNGDDSFMSLMSSVFRGEHMIEALNAAKLDVDTFGNHEFDLGPARLRELITMSKFPWVSANVRDAQTGGVFGAEVGVRPWIVKEVAGIKFGFTGLTPKETPILSSPGPGVLVIDPVVAMNEVVPRMRAEDVQIVVLLSHLGNTETEMVVSQVKGIDVALGDHEAGILAQPKVINGTIVSRRGHELGLLGQLNLFISEGKIVRHTYVEHKVAKTSPIVPEVDAVIKKYEGRLATELNIEIGSTSVPLNTTRAVVRGGEAVAGNLIADALRSWANSDVAIQNGGSIRGDRILESGPLTKRHISEMLPFPNYAVVLRVTGEQLWAALENGLSIEKGSGRFPQVSGLKFIYDPKAPAGARLQEVWVGDSPLDRSAFYTLATSDFIANGGDEYTVLKGAQVIIPASGGPLITSLVIDYIKAQGTISPAVGGRIVIAGAQAPAPELPPAPAPVAAAPVVEPVAGSEPATLPAQLPRAGGPLPLAAPLTALVGILLLAVSLRLRGAKA